jgi:hypothetical protein
MECNEGNGRVNILGKVDRFPMMMSLDNPIQDCTDNKSPGLGWYATDLSIAFFSAKNIKILQNGIRAGVYKRSNGNYIVGEQSCEELKTVMRSTFLTYSKNLGANIKGQIEELNEYVLKFCIGEVYEEATFYMKYKKDVSTLPIPMALPILPYTNDKQLELKKWF